MHRSPGYRLARLLRFPALALLVLAVLINPVLAAVGDLHETGSGAAHLHDVGDHGATPENGHGDGTPQEHDDGDGDLLHALMHASHCCGHPTALPAYMVVASIVPLADAVPVRQAQAPQAGIASDLFRPPIAA
ncbi:hypothetical protein [Pseudoxanthomonas wuyuanensis]|uniref:DUF2946 domain-containing protein n=1 Tax=Pseudoxanthomonas wuyuanensis TaxID=1073196 RepID=A0A286D066_9GAMM|nr:hypothetical protein [Pseudoxanthomonas wuyuanensis]SOD52009.1 hypothetical protein SAMN06296416_101985 [Pseudoxanthomonas wuyuanensis]